VRDYLATLGPPDLPALVRAATHYEEQGELGIALRMLLAAGEAESAALLLAEADLKRTEAIDALELLAVTGRIPDAVLDRHPRALFHVARACGVAAFLAPRSKLLQRLNQTVGDDDPRLRRAIDAELATDIINTESPVDALPLARSVLASATADEQLTRARALTVMGQATCFRRDENGTLSDGTLREAAEYFEQAMQIYLALGYGEAVNGPAIERAIRVELGGGHPEAALKVLDVALAHVTATPRRFSTTLRFRAQALTELGRHDESQAALDEVLRIAAQCPGSSMVAQVHWERMVLASMRGDGASAVDHANQVEANASDWWAAVGMEFMAEAADCLDRAGQTAAAWRYLERVHAGARQLRVEPHLAMAESAVLARHGDPALAEERLIGVHRFGIAPRERWRVTLLRAYAAWRRGDPDAGPLAARAFEEAARLGQPQLPLIRERELTEAVLALALETGSPAAEALDVSSLPVSVSVLGPFEITSGGRPVAIGPGQATQLLKIVALSGGKLLAEQAIEALWPEVDPGVGRNRLRTVLARLRQAVPEAVQRDGELLALGEAVRLDLAQFHREARQALALRTADAGSALALARSAMARYRGELLPHDLYESWAEEPREAARRTMLELVHLSATAAAVRGDLDEARRMVERALELAPFEDDSYLSVARIFRQDGRRGAALSVLRRARAVLAPLGIDVPLELPESGKTVAA
jgi:DNA-binding SARP family transcriptional activator